ncbi:hypothetical protein BKA62DRAFT_772656 [Auriculariales sp. MPI-PUGE-AT-0066]|nr:hypothetical protein BKA62DRAFT_772656 [Auriculariales sp. MPI-PUGE-AT-0066]
MPSQTPNTKSHSLAPEDPFAVLPPELLQAFTLHLDDSPALLPLLLVSRYWYYSLIDTPLVWTRLTWAHKAPRDAAVRRLERCIRLSGAAPLAVRVADGYGMHYAATAHATGLYRLRAQMHRVMSLQLDVAGDASMYNLLRQLDVPVPLLRRLCVWNASRQSDFAVGPMPGLLSAPNLKMLLASNLPLEFVPADLTLLKADVSSDVGGSQQLEAVMLRNANTLESLRFTGSPKNIADSQLLGTGCTYNFPALRDLEVRGVPLGSLLGHMRAPSLITLSIADVGTLASFDLLHSLPCLERLDVMDFALESNPSRQLHLPKLRRISVRLGISTTCNILTQVRAPLLELASIEFGPGVDPNADDNETLHHAMVALVASSPVLTTLWYAKVTGKRTGVVTRWEVDVDEFREHIRAGDCDAREPRHHPPPTRPRGLSHAQSA